MRHAIVDTDTGRIRTEALSPDMPLPPNTKALWLPRIRCNDCPGKLYPPGSMTVDNFEIHLKHRAHREKVDQRTGGGGQVGVGTGVGGSNPAAFQTYNP